ncbi:MAG: CoA transferase, partial [Thermodesulfobacteriota bacterium]|nr:CoA transferase [Thermodesulfobacteriota bacterium]
DEEWQNFCKVTNHAEWIDDIRFSTITARKENEDKLEKLIAEWTKDHTAEEIESRMQKAGVAASVVENIKDIFEDPQIAHRDHIRMMDWHWPGRQENELTAFSGVSFKMSKVKDNQRPPDIYGESNVYVLKEFLGMTNDDISDLYAEGVLTTEDDFLKLLGLK